MSQDRGNEGIGKDDSSTDKGLDNAVPGMSYDLFGNQLMPAAPDPVRPPDIVRSTGADRSASPPSFGAVSAPSSQQQQQQQQPASAVSPVTYAIAGVAALALIGGGFFLVKNMMSNKSSAISTIAVAPVVTPKTPDTTPLQASGAALSAHEVFTKCMPSIVMLTVHYKGFAVLNEKIHLTWVDGNPVLVTTDDNDHFTFYDKDEKPTKQTVGYVTVDGTKYLALVKVDGDKFSAQAMNDDGRAILIGGKPLLVTTGFEFAKNPLGATGSGYFVRPDIVATNHHVVSMGSIGAAAFKKATAQITDKPGQYEITEKPIYVDPYHDLALLYVPGTPAKPLPLHADLSDLKVGDPVYTLGSPQGYSGSISEGVISSDRLREDIRRPHGERFMIQHSAKIDHGNSGGPLVNAHGEVLGVNTLTIGSAVSLSIAEKEVDAILNRPEVIAKIEALQKNNGPDLGAPSQTDSSSSSGSSSSSSASAGGTRFKSVAPGK